MFSREKKENNSRRRKKRRGVAMIYGLIVFLLISILAVAMTRLTDGNTVSAGGEYKKTQAEYIARAGLEIGQGALHVEDASRGKATLFDRILGKPVVVSHHLNQGYTNIDASHPSGEFFEIKSEKGEVVGRVQLLVYSLTGKEAAENLTVQYRSPDATGETHRVIDRLKEAKALGVDKLKQDTWVFRIVAIGETMDYDEIKGRFPMARQIMTADVNINNPLSVRIYSGY